MYTRTALVLMRIVGAVILVRPHAFHLSAASKMSTAAPAPVNVSPLIKFGRWSLLIAGIGYGAFHHNRLSRKENRRRAREEQIRIENAPRIAAEKARAQKEELEAIAKAGLKFN